MIWNKIKELLFNKPENRGPEVPFPQEYDHARCFPEGPIQVSVTATPAQLLASSSCNYFAQDLTEIHEFPLHLALQEYEEGSDGSESR